MSVINANDTYVVFAFTALLAWIGFAAEKTRWGRVTTGIVWTGGLAILLSNINFLPKSAPAYDFVKSYLVPMAIPLFLFRVNLREIFMRTGRTLGVFAIAAVTTVVGAAIGVLIVNLGPLEAKLAGIFTATYIGGTINFAATSQALEFPDDALLSASLAADSIVGKSYLLILALLPSVPFVRKFFGPLAVEETDKPFDSEGDVSQESPTLFTLASALALSAAVVALGYWVASLLGMSSYGILFITLFSLAPGLLAPKLGEKLEGAFSLGMVCAYLYFAAVGAGADVSTLFTTAGSVMFFAIIIVVIHGALLFPLARLFKFSLAETIIASNACILGPTTAAALAAARGWRHLVTPGLLAGLFGYALGTFLGVFFAELLQS